ncbi:CDP-glycerol glycerophosphotransferase family protein [Alkalihalobacillus sp. AL-G]|uniref:CDP-glycerol glycerophosphotransferase family protein n=1 Tax=Alkalihalobacillus sp. AL-G TaxID=2926399 RepID=UPI00272C0BB3|nr:CDP-glycerol glycerophosphotransferase family protein [Alkalihalobacillus sp. AL-G]WLD92897.1 CDP-glycerol glycerophosphotransferase family protein [Alkalihalobacillus sp. AL-G]
MKRTKHLCEKCHLDCIYYQNNCLYIQVGIPQLPSIDQNDLALLFVERYTTKKKEYLLSNKSGNTYEACLTVMDLHQLLIEGKDWDVYVTFAINDSRERIRLSSNFMDLELLFFVNDGKMLTPFTTNYGNVSFKSDLLGFITKVEHIDFTNKENLGIKGYVVNPSWLALPANLKQTLVLSTNDHEYTFKMPLKIGARENELKTYRHEDDNFHPIGFEALIPLKAILTSKSEAITLKAWIQITYSEGNRNVTAETYPIKLKSPAFKNKSIVKKVNGKKKRISINRTLKARHLKIIVDQYDFKNDIKVKVKEKLLFIKRHSLVRELYKKAFSWIGTLPANKKLIVFESFHGKQFSDNPRAIYEYLQEKHYPYKLYWSVDKKYLHNFQGKNLKIIRKFSVKWLLIMPRARYWVTNSRMPLWLPKPKHTIYFQTWHGTPLKRLAADMDEVHIPGTTAEKYKTNFIKEAKNWDYLISPNAYSTEIFRRAFQFDKKVLETGYPRNDFICQHNNEETIGRLRTDYGIPMNKRVILYAPTWRDNQFYSKGKYRFDITLDLDLMKEKLGEDFVMLFRLHYLVSENLDLSPYEGFAYDFSDHEDIRELYLMADILITDYSSVFFDYGNLKRPMIFYVDDIEQYRHNLRGFYFDFEQEAPGPLVKTTEEVIRTVKQMEEDGFPLSPRFDSFYERFCYLEYGDSASKVVKEIFRN